LHFSTLAKRSTLLLFFVLIVLYVYGLGHFPLVGPDEPRYAQVAREMFLRGDLITPTLGGRPWFEKPVLLYWMMMASFKVFGVSEWSARLPSAISGLLTVAAVYCGGNLISSRRDARTIQLGRWSAPVAATMVGILAFSRGASFDIVLTMTTTWAFAFFVAYALEEEENQKEENSRHARIVLAAFYVFVGLSLLAKGLIGIVIPAGVIILFYLFQLRLPGKKTLTSLMWGAPLALAVAATWYVPVIMRNGWPFVDQFFIQHHFARYISNKYHHWQPIYYYLIVVPCLTLPWTALLAERLWRIRWCLSDGRDRRGSDYTEQNLKRLRVFALAWLLFPLLFFSFSSSKLPGYILPAIPAAAFLIGEMLWRLTFEHGFGRKLLLPTGVLYLLAGAGVVAYALNDSTIPIICAVLIAALFLATALLIFFARHNSRVPELAMIVSTFAVLIVSLHWLAPGFADRESSKRLLQLADARGYSHAMIYGMQRSDRTPEFYAAGRVSYGSDGEPIMYEAPWDVIQESRRRGEAVLAFVPLEELERLEKTTEAKTEVIGDNGRYAIVAVSAQ
jgi:4-amino-4-deoxy-L-arabinose transferase-like glycosyltransferase